MKKIIFLTGLLVLLIGFAFAQTPARTVYQQIELAAEHTGNITDYVTALAGTHTADYYLEVSVEGVTRTSDDYLPQYIRVCQTGPYATVVFDQTIWPAVWPEGSTIDVSLTYIPTEETATHQITVPAGSALVQLFGPSAWIGVPPFPAGPEEYTLEVTSNYPGAAIYLDGADTGQVTPYTFDPAEAGTYTLMMDNVVWTPADYEYEAEANAEVYFTGVYGPNAPNVTAPTEGQVFEWTEPGTVDVVWDLDPMVDYYEVKFMEEDWVAVAEGNSTSFDITESGNYYVNVRGVKNDPAPTKIYTKARINDRRASTSAAKGTGAETLVNFEVIITAPYDILPGDPEVIGNSTIVVTGAGFQGANVVTEGFSPVPNPTFVATSEGIIQLVGTGEATLTFSTTDPWFVYNIGGEWIVLAGPLVDYAIVINLGAKDGTFEFKSGTGGDPTLPVELSVFNAVLTAQKFVKLTWVSESETNMLGYRVYRSETNDANSATQITAMMIEATNTSTTQVYSIEDREVLPFSTYYYWLEAVDYNHSNFFGPQFVEVPGEVVPELPVQTAMKNAYPNPFKTNANTNIEVALKAGETGTVTIYNVLGQVVKTYSVNEGSHTLTWNGRDSKGNVCGSGIYFYKLSTPSMNQTKKMVIVK